MDQYWAYRKASRAELNVMCRARNLSTSGSKQSIIARLEARDRIDRESGPKAVTPVIELGQSSPKTVEHASTLTKTSSNDENTIAVRALTDDAFTTPNARYPIRVITTAEVQFVGIPPHVPPSIAAEVQQVAKSGMTAEVRSVSANAEVEFTHSPHHVPSTITEDRQHVAKSGVTAEVRSASAHSEVQCFHKRKPAVKDVEDVMTDEDTPGTTAEARYPFDANTGQNVHRPAATSTTVKQQRRTDSPIDIDVHQRVDTKAVPSARWLDGSHIDVNADQLVDRKTKAKALHRAWNLIPKPFPSEAKAFNKWIHVQKMEGDEEGEVCADPCDACVKKGYECRRYRDRSATVQSCSHCKAQGHHCSLLDCIQNPCSYSASFRRPPTSDLTAEEPVVVRGTSIIVGFKRRLQAPIPGNLETPVNDQIQVIAITRMSARPYGFTCNWADHYQSRNQALADFYMKNHHAYQHPGCNCKVNFLSLVMVIASNTNIMTTATIEVKRMKEAIASAPGEVAVCISGADGWTTNVASLKELLQLVISYEKKFSLMVWEDNANWDVFTAEEMLEAINLMDQGQSTTSAAYGYLKRVVQVSVHKERLAASKRSLERLLPKDRNHETIDTSIKRVKVGLVQTSLPPTLDSKTYVPKPKLLRIPVKSIVENGEPRFQCPEPHCSFSAAIIEDIAVHTTDKVMQLKLPCSLCSNKVMTWDWSKKVYRHAILNHMRLHLLPQSPCSFCSRYLFDKELQKHIETEHLGNDKESYAWVCDVCGGVFQAREYLVHHWRYHHDDELQECEYCGEWMQSRKIPDHRRKYCSANPDRDTRCPTCGVTVPYSSIARHVSVHKRTGEINDVALRANFDPDDGLFTEEYLEQQRATRLAFD